MESEYLLGVPYEHAIDGLHWTAASMVGNIASCQSRLAGMSGDTWLVRSLNQYGRPLFPEIYRASFSLFSFLRL